MTLFRGAMTSVRPPGGRSDKCIGDGDVSTASDWLSCGTPKLCGEQTTDERFITSVPFPGSSTARRLRFRWESRGDPARMEQDRMLLKPLRAAEESLVSLFTTYIYLLKEQGGEGHGIFNPTGLNSWVSVTDMGSYPSPPMGGDGPSLSLR